MAGNEWKPAWESVYTSNMARRFDILHRDVMLRGGKMVRGRFNAQTPGLVFAHHLVRLVEKQAEVGEDHPELLPAVAVLELPQQISRQLVLQNRKRKQVEF